MGNVNGRLTRLESVVEAQREAEQQAAFREFQDWMAANLTPEEDAAWLRCLFLEEPRTALSDDGLQGAGWTRTQYDEWVSGMGTLTEDDRVLVNAALERIPDDLRRRCYTAGVFAKP